MSMAEIVRAKNAMVAMFGYGIDEGHLEDSEDDDDDLRDAALAAGATLRAALADCNARSCGRCFKVLQKPLVCARCKAATYCSKECQVY